MNEDRKNIEFVKEQYSQYYQMFRQHLVFSWQIPSFVIVALLFFLGLEYKNIQSWKRNPIFPAIGFLIIGLFLIVMFVHHRRNLFYANNYSKILAKMEEEWGFEVKVHHFQVEPLKKSWQRISSSLCLSIFLIILIVGSIITSICYFILAIF